MENAKYISLSASVRYWDDAEIDGKTDESGDIIPFKNGEEWQPIIRISDGFIVDWPSGTTAFFHFKVCDAGTYHLLDDEMKIVASRYNSYVPDGLCHGDSGYGDYIIFSVSTDGFIEGYRNKINFDDFEPASK